MLTSARYLARYGTAVSMVLCGISLVPVAATAQDTVKQQFGIDIPMRDGVRLVADLWAPAEAGRYPVIVVRLPYMRTAEFLNAPELAEYFASEGYGVVIQDTRGRGDSDGEFDFFFDDAEDGYDTIEWVAQQPWSNGRVCMMGVSYLATVQWLAARERPPHLVCIVPTAPAGRYFDELPYQGGAFEMAWALRWLNGTSGRNQQSANAVGVDWDAVYEHRPLLTMDSVMGRVMPIYRAFLEHNTLDDYWKRIQFTAADFEKIDIPALHVTGWFDGDQPGAMYYWRGMAAHSPATDKQYLLSGPWDHVQTFVGGETEIGDMEFTGESIVDNKAIHLAFFDHYLKGTAREFDFPRARVYVTGANVWKDLDAYPPGDMERRPLYFHSAGSANSLIGDGTLSWDRPADEPFDRYTYDPSNPVPSAVGDEYLGVDQRPIERRDDVLVYTSDVLRDPLEVIGDVFVVLHAASDALDTDFTAKLMDVYPDGRAVKLGPSPVGIIRARYRNGYERTELLTPHEAVRYRIELYDIAHTFLPGHRIRVEVSSSAFPSYNPNQNTGNPVATDTEWKVARQSVYHDRSRPSHVLLPVIPKR